MKRTSSIVSGYDCRVVCEHTIKGEHGIHGDEWLYVVSNGTTALSLTVMTPNYPSTVTPRTDMTAHGADLTVHTPFPVREEDIREGFEGHECQHVDGGRCFTAWSGCLAADMFWKEWGQDGFEQPESFWLALEARLVELTETIRDEVRPKRCPTCKGCGLVDRTEG